jgi:hypothetical protein
MVFVPFKLSLMFASKAGACLIEKNFQMLKSRVGSWPYPETIDYLERPAKAKHSSLFL